MTATMLNMDLKKVDVFNVDILMPEDLIGIDGIVCEIKEINSLKDGYAISYLDEYGELEVIEVSDDAKFDFYVYIED